MKRIIATLIYILSFGAGNAQCGYTAQINNLGSACLGQDTLILSGASGVAQIQWFSGNTIVSTTSSGSTTGVTVAGGNGAGSAANQFDGGYGVFVDKSGNVYVADYNNNRVQKWAPGATSGTTVAGGNGNGSGANQFSGSSFVFVDTAGNIYVSDQNNCRVQKWAAGATTGITVAGGHGLGSGANQFFVVGGLYVDAVGNVYAADIGANRIQKWAPGATSGTTVAGGHGSGSAANQLNGPTDVFVDTAGNIYIADASNNRIQQWENGAITGITVAGGNGSGTAANQLNNPNGIYVNNGGAVFVADLNNNRVQEWAPGAINGITVAGHADGSNGSGAADLAGPHSVFVNSNDDIYIADALNNRVQKWATGLSDIYVPLSAGNYKAVVTGTGGCTDTSNIISVSFSVTPAVSISAHSLVNCSGEITSDTFTAVSENGGTSPVFQWYKNGVTSGSNSPTFISGSLNNNDSIWVTLLSNAACALTDTTISNKIKLIAPSPVTITLTSLHTGCLGADTLVTNGAATASQLQVLLNGNLIDSLKPYSSSGLTVAGGNGAGAASNQLNVPNGIAVDKNGNIYITDFTNNRIQKWAPGASSGTTLPSPLLGNSTLSGVFVDSIGNVYVSENSSTSAAIMELPNGSSFWNAVAGGNANGSGPGQFNGLAGIYVDAQGNMYCTDFSNHRVQKWAPGASSGITVAGGNGSGSTANQLSYPRAACADATGNIYVADFGNNRIQKWAPGATSGITIAGGNGAGTGLSQLNSPYDVTVDTAGNVFVADFGNNRIQKWIPGSATGVTVAGQQNGVQGNSPYQLFNPSSTCLNSKGDIYIADQSNNRVQKWTHQISANTIYFPWQAGNYRTVAVMAGGCTDTSNAVTIYPSFTSSVNIAASAVSVCGQILNSDTFTATAFNALPGAAYQWYKNGASVGTGQSIFVCGPLNNNDSVWVSVTGAATCSTPATFTSDKITVQTHPAVNISLSTSGASCTGVDSLQISGSSIFTHFQWLNNDTVIANVNQNVTTGITDAGNLRSPVSIAIGRSGALYVADEQKNQVQKWLPGAGSGTVVAGCASGAYGSGPDSLKLPQGIFVDANDNLYIADNNNNRIQKWLPGATLGLTVAGTGSSGPAPNELSGPTGIYVDAPGNIYVVDAGNNRVQKFAAGSSTAVTVAGGHGAGSGASQLNAPFGVKLDAAGNVFVADQGNSRIQKWAPGDTAGTTVAAYQLVSPQQLFIDNYGDIYVVDANQNRIQKFPPNGNANTPGVTVAGGNGTGSASNQLYSPTDVLLDPSGDIIISDYENQRVVKWANNGTISNIYKPTLGGLYTVIADVAGGCADTSNSVVVNTSYTASVSAAASKISFCAGQLTTDTFSATPFNGGTGVSYQWFQNGQPVGGNNSVYTTNTLRDEDNIWVAMTTSLVCTNPDPVNSNTLLIRVSSLPFVTISAAGNTCNTNSAVLSLNNTSNLSQVMWFNNGNPVSTIDATPATSGIDVAGNHGQSGSNANEFDYVSGVTVDTGGNIYVADNLNLRIQKWAPGATTGITVAGGNGYGSAANQLYFPYGITLDKHQNLYVADWYNNRIMKFAQGVNSGTAVATGHQPANVFVDDTGNIYVADQANHRIQKWLPGATSGITIAGGNGPGVASNQLNTPSGVVLDASGYLYVADAYNQRVQRFPPGSTSATAGTTVAGQFNGLGGSSASELGRPFDVRVDNYGNLYVADYDNNRVQLWAPGATSGITIAGGHGLGLDSNQVPNPIAIYLDTVHGSLYIGEGYYDRVQRWDLPKIGNTSFTPFASGNYWVQVTDSRGCTSTSNTITIGPSNPIVNISASRLAVCSGAIITDTFTAVPSNGGVTPAYQWYKNGAVTGTNDSVLISNNISAGDSIWVTLTSNSPCALVNTVESNRVLITGIPVSVPSVTISAQQISFCAGSIKPDTFNASFINGGNSPHFEWYKNGLLSGNDSSGYVAGVLNDQDSVWVIGTSNKACANPQFATSNTIIVSVSHTGNQGLCMVTIDTATGKPVILWEKDDKYATDSFYLYRSTTPNSNFLQVASLDRDTLSQWPDAGAQPDASSYRYKIALMDSCGNISSASNYHQSIYLTADQQGQLTWTPYIIENSGTPGTGYDVYRETQNGNNWQLILSVPNTQTSVFDTGYGMYPNARYLVSLQLPVACNPQRGLNTIFSNIANSEFTSVSSLEGLENIKLFPNPLHNELTVYNSSIKTNYQDLVITDISGKVIYQSHLKGSVNIIVTEAWLSGVYFCKIQDGDKSYVYKVVKM